MNALTTKPSQAAFSTGGTRVAFVLSFVMAVLLAGPLALAQETVSFTPDELAALHRHFVVIEVYFKRNEEEQVPTSFYESILSMSEDESSGDMYMPYIQMKKPAKVAGIVTGPKSVLIRDYIIDEDYLDHAEAVDWQGNRSPVTRAALLKGTSAMRLELAQPDALDIAPVEFTAREGGETAGAYTQVIANWFETRWALAAMPLAATEVALGQDGQPEAYLRAGGSWDEWSSPFPGAFRAYAEMSLANGEMDLRSPGLILDAEGAAAGIAFAARLPMAEGAVPLWRGSDLLADEQLAFEALTERQESLKKSLGAMLYEVEIKYRQEAEDDDSIGGLGAMLGAFGGAMDDFMGDEAPTDQTVYGLALSPRELFIPLRPHRELTKRIESITVRTNATDLAGQFAGAYKDIAAFRISVDGQLPAFLEATGENEKLPLFEPLLTLKARKQRGEKQLETSYSRVTRYALGYKDVPEPILMGSTSPGVFYTDTEGTLQAVLLEQRKDDEAAEQFRDSDSPFGVSFDSFSPFGKLVRPYTMPELASYLSDTGATEDKTFFVLGEEEEHRRMWLGVEFDEMTPDLAETMSLEKPTKDGKIGLLVSAVYEGSPAEKIGLEPGAVLLRIKSGADGPAIDLKAPPNFDFEFDFSELELPDGMEDMVGLDLPQTRPWKSRNNYLTKMLGALGEGTTISLTYLDSAGKTQTVTYTIEKAPADYESAKTYKSNAFGVTAKEVTYDVRRAVMVPAAAAPVVVSSVEKGTPAEVAKVRQYDLVMKVNDEPVQGLDGFKTMLEEAVAAHENGNKTVLRLNLQRLGKTRIADLILD